jgi:hypothetical protein
MALHGHPLDASNPNASLSKPSNYREIYLDELNLDLTN